MVVFDPEMGSEQRDNKASVIETETKKKVHVGVKHDSREKMIIPKQEVAEPVSEAQLFENEDSLPECVKKFLKRKRQGQPLSAHQRTALMKMIQAKKRRKVEDA